MIKAYKTAIFYYLVFSTLLLISSVMIFEQKIGFDINSVIGYYRGDEALFIPPKSISGVLKIVLPHIFVFGLFGMVLLHFIVFTSQRDKIFVKWLIYLFFITSLIEIFSPIMIILGFDTFAYLKLLSFFIFEFLLVFVLALLVFSLKKV